jgi:hypothetical protein
MVEIFVYDPTCSHKSKTATRVLIMFKNLDDHLKGRSISWSHILELKTHIFKASMLPTIKYGLRFGDGT